MKHAFYTLVLMCHRAILNHFVKIHCLHSIQPNCLKMVYFFQTLGHALYSKQKFYRLGQENAYWLRNLSLIKNPHFWCYQVDILLIWPKHEVVILTKFHQSWTKIDNLLLIAHFLSSSHSPAHICTPWNIPLLFLFH